MKNREIKFRAWDEERKLMIYDFENIEHPVAIEYYITGNNGELKIGATKTNGDFYELKPLLSTGLKDKNGKEIYEGDIYHQGDTNIRYQVIFKDGGFVGNQIGNKSLAGLQHWIEKIEVIGNIHENAGLLAVAP